MPKFHETRYGHRFFEAQLPELITQLKRIADALEKIDSRLENEEAVCVITEED